MTTKATPACCAPKNTGDHRKFRPSCAHHSLIVQPLRALSKIAAEETALLALARQHRLTVHDAAYLELAQREGLPLATLDDELARAAQAENVTLIGNTRRSA